MTNFRCGLTAFRINRKTQVNSTGPEKSYRGAFVGVENVSHSAKKN